MAKYAIILSSPSKHAWDRVKEVWPSHYILNERVAFIESDEPRTTTSKISGEVGMDDDKKISGIVIQVGHYNGFEEPELWEWLENSQ